MTDKELTQIEAWLSGQARYKLLDCRRRALLKLKGARLQVWMAHYIREKEQQSWLSLDTLMADTGLSRHTVIDARRWLVENGWIRVLEGSAADMYDNPTQGAHKVRIMCVDDPTKTSANTARAEIAPASESEGVQKLHVQKIGAEIAPNVTPAFASAVAFASTGAIAPTCTCTSNQATDSSLRSEDEKQKPPQKQKPIRSAPVAPATSAGKKKFREKYGADKPDWFDDAAHTVEGQLMRSRWIELHTPPSQDELDPLDDARESAPLTPPPSSATPPPRGGNDAVSVAKFQCPACDYGHRYGFSVAEHIEEKHPELGQHCFPIHCSRCTWSIAWNKVDDNQAQRETESAEHLEMQHNPKSPRYDPWGVCGCVDWHSLSQCPKRDKV